MYKGGGYFADVRMTNGKYTLTVRNKRMQLVKRRRYRTRTEAMDVLWLFVGDENPTYDRARMW